MYMLLLCLTKQTLVYSHLLPLNAILCTLRTSSSYFDLKTELLLYSNFAIPQSVKVYSVQTCSTIHHISTCPNFSCFLLIHFLFFMIHCVSVKLTQLHYSKFYWFTSCFFLHALSLSYSLCFLFFSCYFSMLSKTDSTFNFFLIFPLCTLSFFGMSQISPVCILFLCCFINVQVLHSDNNICFNIVMHTVNVVFLGLFSCKNAFFKA